MWLTDNLDLLIRTCFALESEESQHSAPPEPVSAPPHVKHFNISAPLKESEGIDSKKLKHFRNPSNTTDTTEVLSISTLAESANSIIHLKTRVTEPTPSLDSNISQKRRHRRDTSQHGVLGREGIEISGLLSSGRFGPSLLGKYKKENKEPCLDHQMVTLNTYHKCILSETYQQHVPYREKQLLESFDHPFISTVLASFSDRNCLYLVSPAEPGGTLSRLLQNALSHGITDKLKVFYAACVLSVLKYAHSLNIIHRGLHPDSLLIDGKGYLKVTDWGFAKLVTDRTFTLCGHVDYLCPEALAHDTGYGKGADYWAFGVLIYDMFVGRSAFSPSSLDFKYDVDRIVIGTGAGSSHSTSTSGSGGKSSEDSIPTNRSQSKSPPLSGDTLGPCGPDSGTVNNILTREPVYPSCMPHTSKSIVQGLCQKNITQRLGTRRGGKGIDDIQKHIFFQDVEWARLQQKLVAAPWVPTLGVEAADADSPVRPIPARECAKYYPNYRSTRSVKDVELFGPSFKGYHCPDWNSFV